MEPHDRVTWEVTAPGFHALHSYRFAALDRSAAASVPGRWPRARPTGRSGASGWRTSATSAASRWPGRGRWARARGRAGKRSAQSSCWTPQALITCAIRLYQPASTSSSTSWPALHSGGQPRPEPVRDGGGVVELVDESHQQAVALDQAGSSAEPWTVAASWASPSPSARPKATACTPHSYSAPNGLSARGGSTISAVARRDRRDVRGDPPRAAHPRGDRLVHRERAEQLERVHGVGPGHPHEQLLELRLVWRRQGLDARWCFDFRSVSCGSCRHRDQDARSAAPGRACRSWRCSTSSGGAGHCG